MSPQRHAEYYGTFGRRHAGLTRGYTPTEVSVSYHSARLGPPITKAATATVSWRSGGVCNVSGAKLLLDASIAGGTRTHLAEFAGVCTAAKRSLRCTLSAA